MSVVRIDTAQTAFDVVFTKVPKQYEDRLHDTLVEAEAQIVLSDHPSTLGARFDKAHHDSEEDLRMHLGSLLADLGISSLVKWQIFPVWEVLVHLKSALPLRKRLFVSGIVQTYKGSVSAWGKQSFTFFLPQDPSEEFKDRLKRILSD